MKKLLALSVVVFSLLMGCGQKTDKAAFMTAFSGALAGCKGEVGCITSLNVALYTGQFSDKDDSWVSVLAAFFPYARLAADVFNTAYTGAGGGGQGFVLNRSNNNTFIMPRTSADRGATVTANFDATTSITETHSYENMYNPDSSVRWDK